MPHAGCTRRLLPLLPVILLAFAVPPAVAQGTGRSMDIDGSAISSAMGGASAAAFWSAEPNYWANPALLGYYHGVRYQHAHSQLVPGIASDVTLNSSRVTLAACGLGLALGGTKLDYGTSMMVDEGGNPAGTFGSWEKYGVTGVGLSLSELFRAVAPGTPLAAATRHFDLAGGITRKSVEIKLAPAWLQGKASGTTQDMGMLMRGGFDLAAGTVPLRVDVAFGTSVLNYNDVSFRFINEDQASPPSRMRRVGGAVRLSVGLPASRSAASPFAKAFLRGFDPIVSFGAALDDEHVQAGSSSVGAYEVHHYGVELTYLNVLSVRAGHVTDRLGEIEGGTWGFGIGLPIAGVAGARYDYAHYPQSTALPDVTRHTASVFVDPLAIWRLSQERDGERPGRGGRRARSYRT
jgi:hypothetical protein